MRLDFGDFVFDTDTREVITGGKPLAISPKAFTLLDLLIECRPKAVSKADIRSRLWPDVHVSDANLGNLVVELRSAIGDDARKPRVIRTVARFGYAFIAPVAAGGGRVGIEPGARGLAYRLVWGRREIALDPGNNLIGRDREAVVWIDDESVSRHHARILIGDEGVSIEDLASKNGTYVGGKRIQKPAPLTDRDVIRIGPATLTLRVLRRTDSTRSTVKERSSK
jgi:DNA-binding winged helix-turn-helix (wHTH) protein